MGSSPISCIFYLREALRVKASRFFISCILYTAKLIRQLSRYRFSLYQYKGHTRCRRPSGLPCTVPEMQNAFHLLPAMIAADRITSGNSKKSLASFGAVHSGCVSLNRFNASYSRSNAITKDPIPSPSGRTFHTSHSLFNSRSFSDKVKNQRQSMLHPRLTRKNV